jgi:hypothetical protein
LNARSARSSDGTRANHLKPQRFATSAISISGEPSHRFGFTAVLLDRISTAATSLRLETINTFKRERRISQSPFLLEQFGQAA